MCHILARKFLLILCLLLIDLVRSWMLTPPEYLPQIKIYRKKRSCGRGSPLITFSTSQDGNTGNLQKRRKSLKGENKASIQSSASFPTSTVADAQPPRPRKVHKNKYASLAMGESDISDGTAAGTTGKTTIPTKTTSNTFKKTIRIDPLLEAIRKKEETERREKQKELETLPIRGTTVPTLLGSAAASKANPSSAGDHRSKTEKVEVGEATPSTPTTKSGYHPPSKIIPSDPFTFGYVQIGTCLGPHGVKGELKVLMDSELGSSYLKNGQLLYVKMPNRRSPRAIRLESARRQVDLQWLVVIEGITSRLGAAALKSYSVFVKKSDRPQLSDNEYLIRDLVGMSCYLAPSSSAMPTTTTTTTNDATNVVATAIDSNKSHSPSLPFATVEGVVPAEELGGTLSHLMHSMLELRLGGDSNQLCLIPLVPQIVTLVDIENNRIEIDPPIGLLDLTYEEVSVMSVMSVMLALCSDMILNMIS